MRLLLFLCPLALVGGQIAISPSQPTVTSGKSITLTSNAPVTWSLNGNGTLTNVTSTSATYTAPTGVVARNSTGGCPVGPNDSIFNTRIDSLPVNAKSGQWISGSLVSYAIFERGNWGISIADGSTPTRTMRTWYSDVAIPNFVMPSAGPNLKRQEGDYIGTFGWVSPPDHHVVTVRHTDCTFYETYDDYISGLTRTCRDGTAGCTVQSAITYHSMDYAIPAPDAGPNAAGIPLAPTLWQLSEIESGFIGHATQFTTNAASVAFNSQLWPAGSTGGGCDIAVCPNAMPLGVRLRLKSSFNNASVCNSGVTAQDAACSTMLTALKQYGMFLVDTGSANAIQLPEDVSLDPTVEAACNQLRNALMSFSNFEAVDESSLEVSATSYQVCPLGKACLNGTNYYVSPVNQAVVTASAGSTSASAPIAIQPVTIGLGVPPITGIASGSYSYQIPYWVNGSTNQSVTWSLVSGPGSVTSAGVYAPPTNTSGAGVVQTAVLKGVSSADSAVTATLTLTVLPNSSGTLRIDTGSPVATTDGNGNVWTADIGADGGGGAVTSDYPHWTPSNVASTIVYETQRRATDVGYTLIVPNGTYNTHLLFGLPDSGSCSPCTTWIAAGWWDAYTFAPLALEVQGQVQNANYNLGATVGYLYQKPADTYLNATVTNNLLQVYVRSQSPDVAPFYLPASRDTNKSAMLNGLEVIPTSVTTTASMPAAAPGWTINTNGQTTISPGQTLLPFTVVATGGAPNDPTWSIVSGPAGATISGGTLSLASNVTANGAAIVVQASDGNYSATATITTSVAFTLTPKVVSAGSSFAYRRALTIAHSSVGASDLQNFTVTVSVADKKLANQAYGGHVASASGYDIVLATDTAGRNLLSWEVEQYDETAGTWIAHVLIPNLSHTSDTTIYLLYGNAQITSQQTTPTAAWNSGYSAVYHYEGPPSSVKDSTSNGNSATQNNFTYWDRGHIGGAGLSMNSAATIPAGLLDQSTGTFEAWVWTGQPQDSSHSWLVLSQTGATKSDYFRLGWYGPDNQFEAAMSSSKGGATRLGFSAAQVLIAAQGWDHVAYSWDATKNLQSLYINGVLMGSVSHSVPVPSTGNPLILGALTASGTSSLDGLLDETRFSNVVRSSDWIAAEYSNQVSPASFAVLGAEIANN